MKLGGYCYDFSAIYFDTIELTKNWLTLTSFNTFISNCYKKISLQQEDRF